MDEKNEYKNTVEELDAVADEILHPDSNVCRIVAEVNDLERYLRKLGERLFHGHKITQYDLTLINRTVQYIAGYSNAAVVDLRKVCDVLPEN